jgi:methyl-accepting chemotaxis protein
VKDWTIKKRIIFCFAIILVLVTGLACTSFTLLRRAKADARSMNREVLPGAVAMSDINLRIEQIQIGVLRVLMAKTPADRKQFEDDISAKRSEILNIMDGYDKNIHLPEDREMYNQLVTLRDQYVAARNQLFELVNAGKEEDAAAFAASTLRPAYEAYAAQGDRMLKWNMNSALSSSGRVDQTISRASLITSSVSVAVLVLGVLFAGLTVKNLNRILSRLAWSLGDGSAHIASAAAQVSTASQTLAEGASEQAASIEETGSSLEELAAMTRRNAENSKQANDIAKQARAAADKGAADMQTMNAAMEAIKTSSDDIAKIIKTIDEIAFQTNILALNAAVEAARAGEAGMGFAVVADEVRNLAQRSAQAAKETAAKIEGAMDRSNQGVQISGKVARALNEIVTKAREVDDLASEVAHASGEQTQGITQINSAVGQMDKVTQSNAATAEESAAAAEELNAQAETMKQSVAELLKLVGGRQNIQSPARPPIGRTAKVQAATGENRVADRSHVPTGGATPAMTRNGSQRDEIPLEGSFENF